MGCYAETGDHLLKPPEGESCKICYEDIDDSNYVEYQTCYGSKWYPSKFCMTCVEMLKDSQFTKYVNDLANTTCAKEQKRLIDQGPPINIHDPHGFPESVGEELYSLWYFVDKQVRSAKLTGSLEGEERAKYCEASRQFRLENEKESVE